MTLMGALILHPPTFPTAYNYDPYIMTSAVHYSP